MDKRLLIKLAKARKDVREKLRGLTSEIASSQEMFETRFRPLTEPIKNLISEIKQEKPVVKKEEISIKKSPAVTSTPNYLSSSTPRSKLRQPSFLETEEISKHIPDEEIEPSVVEPSLSEIQRDIDKLSDTQAFREFLEQWPELPRQYIEEMLTDKEDKFDFQYGVRYSPEKAKFFIGNSEIDFINDELIIQNIRYPSTPGLMELLFKKEPIGFKDTDRLMYKEIVERTNANRKNYQANEQVAGNVGIKYKSIIKPLSNQPKLLTVQNKFNKPSPPPATSSSRTRSGSIDTSKPGSVPMSRARSGTLPTTSAEKSKASIKTKAPSSSSSSSPAKSKGGKGLRTLEVTNKNIEYVPWNNPNKLVDRLRLLISSQLAGNTSHSNEINLIINELREAKIII
jgi:hypothetical protein